MSLKNVTSTPTTSTTGNIGGIDAGVTTSDTSQDLSAPKVNDTAQPTINDGDLATSGDMKTEKRSDFTATADSPMQKTTNKGNGVAKEKLKAVGSTMTSKEIQTAKKMGKRSKELGTAGKKSGMLDKMKQLGVKQVLARKGKLSTASGNNSSSSIGEMKEAGVKASATKKAALAETNKSDAKIISKFKFVEAFSDTLDIEGTVKEYVQELVEHGLTPDQVKEAKTELYKHMDKEIESFFEERFEQEGMTLKKNQKKLLDPERGLNTGISMLNKAKNQAQFNIARSMHSETLDKVLTDTKSDVGQVVNQKSVSNMKRRERNLSTAVLSIAKMEKVDDNAAVTIVGVLREMRDLQDDINIAKQKMGDDPQLLSMEKEMRLMKERIAEKIKPGLEAKLELTKAKIDEYNNHDSPPKKLTKTVKNLVETLYNDLSAYGGFKVGLSDELSQGKNALREFGDQNSEWIGFT